MSNEQIRHALELGLESASDLLSEAPRSMVMQISARIDAIRSAINSLAAPSVASGAPELPPLPQLDEDWVMCRGTTFTVEQMHNYARAAIAAQAKPSAEEYSEMLREFFCCYAAGGYNDGDSLVPIDRCKSKLEWIVEDQREHAAILANSAPNKALVINMEDWNVQMACVKALLNCTDGELECTGEKLLYSYIADVKRVVTAALNASGVEGV